MPVPHEPRITPSPAPRRRQRRKEDRPGEIIAAAMAEFAERGFGPTRMDDVARRAGVSKGTLFVYFPGKEDLFRAVAQTVFARHVGNLGALEIDPDRPFAETVERLLAGVAAVGEGGLPPMARVMLTESRAFPDLARMWHAEVVSKVQGLLITLIEHAQARGEVRAGPPLLHVFSLLGPMTMAMLAREMFGPVGAPLPDALLPDLAELARQHARTILKGMAPER